MFVHEARAAPELLLLKNSQELRPTARGKEAGRGGRSAGSRYPEQQYLSRRRRALHARLNAHGPERRGPLPQYPPLPSRPRRKRSSAPRHTCREQRRRARDRPQPGAAFRPRCGGGGASRRGARWASRASRSRGVGGKREAPRCRHGAAAAAAAAAAGLPGVAPVAPRRHRVQPVPGQRLHLHAAGRPQRVLLPADAQGGLAGARVPGRAGGASRGPPNPAAIPPHLSGTAPPDTSPSHVSPAAAGCEGCGLSLGSEAAWVAAHSVASARRDAGLTPLRHRERERLTAILLSCFTLIGSFVCAIRS